MSQQVVAAKVTEGDRSGEVFEVKIDLPESIEEALEMYGPEISFSHLSASVIIALQSFVRIQIKKDGATPESVQEAVDKWRPGTKQRGRTMAEKVQDMLGKLSDEERADLLAEYQVE